MPINTMSIPGGWRKETPTAEKQNPVDVDDAQSIPRSAGGAGNDAATDGETAPLQMEDHDTDGFHSVNQDEQNSGDWVLDDGQNSRSKSLANEDDKTVRQEPNGEVNGEAASESKDETANTSIDQTIGEAAQEPTDDDQDASSKPADAVKGDAETKDEYEVKGQPETKEGVENDSKELEAETAETKAELEKDEGDVGAEEQTKEPEAGKEEDPEPEPEAGEKPDLSSLEGKRVNKVGNVVDHTGAIFGRVVEGDVSAIAGRMCDKDGNIRSETGDIVGNAELVPESERQGSTDGPFAELECTVGKEGKVVTKAGDVVGRLISGDPKALFGRVVDQDGDVLDRNGNVIGKAERWEEPVVEKPKGPMAGRKVNREGNVVDEDGNIIGKLVSGDLMTCSGKEVDDDGDVINSKGNTVGHVALLEDIPPEEEVESPEEKAEREQAEKDRILAGKLGGAIEQSLDKLRPILKMITDKVDRAERTPKEELDEEQLVKEVKPLIEEGGKILTETNGMIRGMDPDGRIQKNAKYKSSTKEASPEEHHLAEMLKELTGGVTETIDNAKRKIEDMPHAKKELNPLWGLLTEPLFQIIAAVGLLLNGVLSLVGRLLNGLGLGGLVENILGGLGIDKILSSLGLGSAWDSLTGKS